MGKYSKAIGSLVGSIVAVVLVYLASTGAATCTVDQTGVELCSMFGFSQAQITAGAMAVVSMVMVWAFPANEPPD